jgi:hypothetical protein
MTLNKELVKYQDKLYWIYRKIKETQIKSEHVSELKEYWLCDIVIKGRYQSNDDLLLFLKEIPETTIL